MLRSFLFCFCFNDSLDKRRILYRLFGAVRFSLECVLHSRGFHEHSLVKLGIIYVFVGILNGFIEKVDSYLQFFIGFFIDVFLIAYGIII